MLYLAARFGEGIEVWALFDTRIFMMVEIQNIANANVTNKPFYFIRHGETEWNRRRIYQGISEIPLNETGIKQAQAAAEILKYEPIAQIVTSPLSRAKHTADIIGERLNKPVMIIRELTELSFGEKEGLPIGNGLIFDQWLAGKTPYNAESAIEFHDRIFRGLMKGLIFDAPTLFVSHGGVFMAIRRLLKLMPEHISNCQVVYHEPTFDGDKPWTSSPINAAV